MIKNITTARGTNYSAGDFWITVGTTIVSIEPVYVDEYCVAYIVNISDGTWVEVKDVVEVWREKDS